MVLRVILTCRINLKLILSKKSRKSSLRRRMSLSDRQMRRLFEVVWTGTSSFRVRKLKNLEMMVKFSSQKTLSEMTICLN